MAPDEAFFPLINDMVSGVYGNMSPDQMRREVAARVEFYMNSDHYLDHHIPPLPEPARKAVVALIAEFMIDQARWYGEDRT